MSFGDDIANGVAAQAGKRIALALSLALISIGIGFVVFHAWVDHQPAVILVQIVGAPGVVYECRPTPHAEVWSCKEWGFDQSMIRGNPNHADCIELPCKPGHQFLVVGAGK